MKDLLIKRKHMCMLVAWRLYKTGFMTVWIPQMRWGLRDAVASHWKTSSDVSFSKTRKPQLTLVAPSVEMPNEMNLKLNVAKRWGEKNNSLPTTPAVRRQYQHSWKNYVVNMEQINLQQFPVLSSYLAVEHKVTRSSCTASYRLLRANTERETWSELAHHWRTEVHTCTWI